MSELLTQTDAEPEEKQNRAVSEDSESSDGLDSDGYDPNDPYAAMAKKIDKRNKIVQDYHQRPLVKASKMVVENRANMTYFEKRYCKVIVFFAIIAYVLYTNLSNPAIIRESTQQDRGPQKDFLGSLFNIYVLKDVSREIIMLTISIGGFIFMAKLNQYLDKQEEEIKR